MIDSAMILERQQPGECPEAPTLFLNLKAQYFEQIRAGIKVEEYRLATPYWQKRLHGKTYARIVLRKGYPARDDSSRTIVRPWRGLELRTLVVPLFGPEPQQVYAIRVN